MHPSHAYMIINTIMQIEVIPICSLAKIEKPYDYDCKAFKLNNSTLYYYEHIIIILHAPAVILYDINIIIILL